MKRRLIAGTINRYEAEPGWENVHLDKSAHRPVQIVADLVDLSAIGDAEFDEVRCWQVLEHLPRDDAPKALAEMCRVLRPGGVLDIEVPAIDRVAAAIVEETYPLADLLRMIYGDDAPMPDAHLNVHRWGWTPASLAAALIDAGFGPPVPIDEESLQIRYRATRLP